MTKAIDESKENLAALRNDFMRRWFGIAISVGFATTVVGMEWVQQGRAPAYDEWEHLARLFAAGAATVLSWEGYLLSIETKKLYEFRRYLIDIILVFVYLFLLLTSKFPHYWLALHAITFLIYIVWDCMTASTHPEWYKAQSGTGAIAIYWKGLRGSEVDRGLAVTLIWAIYFGWLWFVSQADFAAKTFVFMVFVVIGLAGYRYNKGKYRNSLLYSYVVPFGAGLALALIVLLLQKFGD